MGSAVFGGDVVEDRAAQEDVKRRSEWFEQARPSDRRTTV